MVSSGGILALLVATSVALLALSLDREQLRSLGSKLLYDDNFIRNELDDKYPYLKLPNGSYTAPRDYFNFSSVLRPTDEFLDKVNMEEYLYQELRATEIVATKHFCSKDIWHYSDQQELQMSGWPEANETKCMQELAYLWSEIEQANQNTSRLFDKGKKNIQLLRWIDSWGRPVSETYYGNSYWVGSYRGCKYSRVPRPAEVDDHQDMQFRYCWGKLVAKGWPERDDIIPRTSLRVGLCLPRSCDTLAANKQMQLIHDILMFNFSPMQQDRYRKLVHVYCLPNNNTIHLSTKVFLASMGAWIGLIVVASLAKLWLDSSGGRNSSRRQLPKLVKYLTIQENYARFLADDAPSAKSRVDLRPLGIVKIFACLGICVGHCFVESYLNYYASTLMFLERKNFTLELSDLFFKILELFTVLSGILGSYIILSRFPKDNINQIIRPKVYLALNMARYLRLAPVLIITLAFIKSTFVHLSEGPFWDYGTGAKVSQLGLCRHLSWWRILLWPIVFDVSSSGGSHYKMECLPASWYIITEIKMFLVVPFYIYIMCKRRRLGLILTMGTILGSMLWHYNLIETQQVYYPQQVFTYGRLQTDHMIGKMVEPTYFSGIHRFHAVAIGLFAGLQLYRYKLNEINKWPYWMRGYYLWPLFVWLSFDLVSATLNELNYRKHGTIPNVQFIKLFPVLKQRLDAITFAILSLRFATDWAPKVMRHTSLVYKLSKLSYCVYIVHTILIVFFMSATEKSRPDAQPLQLFIIFVFIITASLIISLPMYILLESPMDLLLGYFMERNKLAKQSMLASTNDATKRAHKSVALDKAKCN